MTEIVAEFTTNHFGHMGLLCRMVHAASRTGADAVKMQCKHVESFYTQDKLNTPFASPFGKTYRDYRSLFELCLGDWRQFDFCCARAGLPWFCTMQDELSLDWLACPLLAECRIMLKRFKVASSNARNATFLGTLQEQVPTDYEIVVSVAGSTLADVEAIVHRFRDYRRLYILHCVAEYPCPVQRLRLGNIPKLKERFGSDRVRIGYSGHEMGFQPTLAAVELGAEMIERHFCISRHSFVHHIECSLEPEEFAAMVKAIRKGVPAKDVPQEAYASEFGMSEAEREFLVHQTYGQRFLGERSVLKEGR